MCIVAPRLARFGNRDLCISLLRRCAVWASHTCWVGTHDRQPARLDDHGGANRQADHTLRSLRRPGKSGYRIPHGGLYRWVSCPNYLGEIVEWTGWAVMTWSLAGLSFAVWAAANLAPRAWAHHAWYRKYFAEYPPERRALLPGLW